MSNKTWVWPLSWYYRIKELEAENTVLRLAYKDLDAKFRAESIANAIHNTTMASMLASLTSDVSRGAQK
jgi:hypothetical protein